MISIFSEKQDDSIFIMELIECSKRIYGKPKFIHYALGDDIFNVFKKTIGGIKAFLSPPKSLPSQQLNMFRTFGIKDYEQYAL